MPATSEGDSALLNGNFDLVACLAPTGSSNFHRHVAETDQAFGSFEPDDGAIPCSSMEAFDLFAAPFDD
uniref:Uncharacterized protein n=1 Tax=Panagrellus redivivus TaxID=6233 RepID=A0A7E4W7E7_PANRE